MLVVVAVTPTPKSTNKWRTQCYAISSAVLAEQCGLLRGARCVGLA